ncbi:hypothetical protein J7L36_00515 [bacterium]|nr:hypothetical protein [bacterium]
MIEIIPKPTKKPPIWQQILLYGSILLLISSFLSFFLLTRFVAKTQKQIQEIETTLSQERTEEEKALEKEAFDYQNKISDFTFLIERHQYPSKFFDFFQGLCHPKVWFSHFSLNTREHTVEVTGESENFVALSQQLDLFKENQKVRDVSLSNISLGREGKIIFSIYLSFDPEIIK